MATSTIKHAIESVEAETELGLAAIVIRALASYMADAGQWELNDRFSRLVSELERESPVSSTYRPS